MHKNADREAQTVIQEYRSQIYKYQYDITQYHESLQEIFGRYKWYMEQYIYLMNEYNQGLQMANDAYANTGVNIMRDEIKAKLSGNLNQTNARGTGIEWLYKSGLAPTSPAVLIAVGDEFSGNENTNTSAGADKVLWLSIKNLGYTTHAKTTRSSEGIMINFSGTNPTVGGTDSDDANNMFVGPGELFVVKFRGVLCEDLKIGTCTLGSYDIPAAIGTDTVAYTMAALVQDVA